MKSSPCRVCGAAVRETVVDLGMSPLCESYVPEEALNKMEPFFPLHVTVCGTCWLVQLDEYVAPEHIFTEYAYFSSYADSWVEHMHRYADLISDRLGLGRQSFVVEVASNDGYLLQHFVKKQIPVLGIEPAANVAQVAIDKGIPTRVAFFGEALARELAAEGKQADLICGANVLAQVPRPNDFVRGLKLLLKPTGVVTIEFPHLMKLMAENQFDTIYHEHFSYFSFLSAETLFDRHGLVLFDVEELPTHGGSLRIYARHVEDRSRQVTERAQRLRQREIDAGLLRLETYAGFAEPVKETKRKLLEFLISAKRAGKRIAGYGAPGKGNTLLNCGSQLTSSISRWTRPIQEASFARNPHPHLRPGQAPGGPPRVRADPPLEREGRDRPADVGRQELGGTVRGSHSRGPGVLGRRSPGARCDFSPPPSPE
jgi:SAM-dependent methyltransferase